MRVEEQHDHGHAGQREARHPVPRAARVVDRGAAERHAAHVAAERRRGDVGDPQGLQVLVEVGLRLGGDLDARRVEQHGDRGDERDRHDLADLRGEHLPGKVAEARQRGRGKAQRGLRREGPAHVDRFGQGHVQGGEHSVECRDSGRQQHGKRQYVAAVAAHDQEAEGDRRGRGDLCRVGADADIAERERVEADVCDHAQRARRHQPARGAEKAADDRIGNVADRPPGMREPQTVQEHAGNQAAEGEGQQHGADQMFGVDARAQQLLRERGRERCDDGGGGGIGTRDGKAHRGSGGIDGGGDRRRHEGQGDALAEPRLQGPREDHRRK